MGIKRLRPAYPPDELVQVYPRPYDHTQWADHIYRTEKTVKYITEALPKDNEPLWAADLSCGDGAILGALPGNILKIYGDLVENPTFPGQLVGPIEETIDLIPEVNLFICCETLEHLDDPEMVLRKIRAKTSCLVLSTPLGEWDDDNPEHYWGWDDEGIQWLLESAGFAVAAASYVEIQHPKALGYTYQLWIVG